MPVFVEPDDEEISIDQSIVFYPNPASTEITVQFKGEQHAKVSIYDLSGKLHVEDLLESSQQKVSLEGLKSGLYILKVVQGEEVTSAQLYVR